MGLNVAVSFSSAHCLLDFGLDLFGSAQKRRKTRRHMHWGRTLLSLSDVVILGFGAKPKITTPTHETQCCSKAPKRFS